MKRRRKSGYTLIEIILALAILGILAAGFLPVFVSAFMQIVMSGNRSETLHEAQSISENVIRQGTTTDSDSLTFVFSDNGSDPVTVQLAGIIAENGTIELFVPAKIN